VAVGTWSDACAAVASPAWALSRSVRPPTSVPDHAAAWGRPSRRRSEARLDGLAARLDSLATDDEAMPRVTGAMLQPARRSP
jgi:hypothetical protein